LGLNAYPYGNFKERRKRSSVLSGRELGSVQRPNHESDADAATHDDPPEEQGGEGARDAHENGPNYEGKRSEGDRGAAAPAVSYVA